MAKVLVVSPTPTHPTIAGNRSCILSYVEVLKSQGNEVFFFWIINPVFSTNDFSETKDYWGRHFFYFKKNFLHRILEFFLRIINFRGTGYNRVDDLYPWGVKRMATKLQKQFDFDVVIVNYVYLSKVLRCFGNSKKVLFTHDVFTNKFQRTGLDWFSLRPNDEAKALNRADAVIAIQKFEELFYSYLTTKPVFTSYNYFPIKKTIFSGNKNILFISGANKYNIEGIDWFINNVMNKLKEKLPAINLIIGGNICSVLENKYSIYENVKFIGLVDNLLEFYSMGDVAINPVFNGTGLKIKSFEAMSFGKVLIAHPHSMEGIYDSTNCPVKLATSADEYVNLIVELVNDDILNRELSKASLNYIRKLNAEVERVFLKVVAC